MTVFRLVHMSHVHLTFMTLLFFALTFPTGSPAESATASAAEIYQQGLQRYQAKEFSQARDLFKSAWESEPQSALALYNWGLAEVQLGNLGMALGALRRALYVNPDLTDAEQAIDYLLSTSNVGAVNSAAGQWEKFRGSVLSQLSLSQSFFLSLILLVASGWILIRFWGQYHIAVHEEMPLPSIPWLGLAFALLFLCMQTISVLKVYDHYQPRATVIAQTAQVRSAPSADGTPLFEVYAGAEVLLKRREPQWSQVKYPGGLTGWVENQNLFHTSGREL